MLRYSGVWCMLRLNMNMRCVYRLLMSIVHRLFSISDIVTCMSAIVLFVMCHFFPINPGIANEIEQPIATDSRIKTFVYSENEVFPIILHYGYQTTIEFGAGEKIQTYSVGNNYAWQINVVDSVLFIKPMEENIVTNMILITNKRRYYFELQSKDISDVLDQDLVYAIRFFYPDQDTDSVMPKKVIVNNEVKQPSIPVIKPYNFRYVSHGDKQLVPTTVFDDGINTFLQYSNGIVKIPHIDVYRRNKVVAVEPQRVGDYIVINMVTDDKIEMVYDDQKIVTIQAKKQ